MKNRIIPYSAIFLIVISVYWKMIFVFFQQDEWLAMGHIYALGLSRIFEIGVANTLLFGMNRPMGAVLNYIFYTFFGFNTVPIAIFSVFIHISVCILLYELFNLFGRDKILNLILVLLFAFSFEASQAITWFGASVTVPPAIAFLLGSMILYIYYWERHQVKYLIFAFICFYISFLFKEINTIMGIFFLIYGLSRKINYKKAFFSSLPFVFLNGMFLIRYFISNFFTNNKDSYLIINSPVKPSIIDSIVTFIASVSQGFVDSSTVYKWAFGIKGYFESRSGSGAFNENYIALYISLFISLFIITTIILLLKYKYIEKKNFLFGLLIYILLYIPHVFVPKPTAFLEPRYYYAIIIGLLFIFTGLKINRKFILLNPIFLISLVGYITSQIFLLNQNLNGLIKISQMRESVIRQLQTIKLNQDKNNIIYLESDMKYIIDSQTLPFQQGVGYTLAVIYHGQNTVSNAILLDYRLWYMGAQAYVSDGNNGFGYFHDKLTLKDALSKISSKPHIIKVKYDQKTNRISEI
jgi:hypothetical protein